ncbi:hypothetical protein CD798_08385 [Bacillaceae bacterium SAOS 7]|nr:hypothetical protein CD798_08385 [Bacillaceae bacterium SAOS 7]
MREVLFRGKSVVTGEWVYGSLIKATPYGAMVIYDENQIIHSVDVETVGQYTGSNDAEGNEIFTGDIVSISYDKDRELAWKEEVIFHLGAFMAGDENLITNVNEHAKVIGNVYESPELLTE